MQTDRSQYNFRAMVAAADKPAIMDALRNSGNPATRRGAEALHRITMMHAANDYTTAMQHQHAGDALRHLPTGVIDWLVADYLGEHEAVSADVLTRELEAMREAR